MSCGSQREISELLAPVLKKLGVKDYSVLAGSVKELQGNYTSVIVKVRVQAERERYFIIKSITNDEYLQSISPIDKMYERETYCYRKVFPAFQKLMQEKCLTEAFDLCPKFYDSSGKVIILEDMAFLGYLGKDQFGTLNYEHVVAVLKGYAQLHALGFALRDQKREIFDSVATNVRDFLFTDSLTTMRCLFGSCCKRVLSLINPIKEARVFETFAKAAIDYPNLMNEVFGDHASDYNVFTHTDCRLSNLLFKYNEKGAVAKTCLLDWQVSSLASPVVDVFYAILVNTDKDLREKHYGDLLKVYYSSFGVFLRKLGSDPDRLFPFETLQEHLKKYGSHALFFAIISMITVFDLSGKHIDKSVFEKRIKNLVVDCHNLGYLNR